MFEPPTAITNTNWHTLSLHDALPILILNKTIDAAWAEAGLIEKEKLLSLRKIDSDLEGHPTPRLNFVDVATGSLGQGLSAAAGMAYVAKYIEKVPVGMKNETDYCSVYNTEKWSSNDRLNNYMSKLVNDWTVVKRMDT